MVTGTQQGRKSAGEERRIAEDAARLTKTVTLVQYLADQMGVLDGDDPDAMIAGVANMDEDWWATLARDAGTRKPSEVTRDHVVRMLRSKLTARRNRPADPFEGLPRC